MGGLYLTLMAVFGAFHVMHVIFVTVILAVYLSHPKGRLFFLFGCPYVVYVVLFDLVRFLPRLWPHVWAGPHVHVADIYHLDLTLFGIWTAEGRIPLMDLFRSWSTPFLDCVIGIGYLTHSLGLLVLALLFFFRRHYRPFQALSLAFLVMNLMAIVTFIFYPVAPPWYVDQQGFLPPGPTVEGNAAGLLAVDRHLQTSFMKGLFNYTPIVFGALPSMHAGFVMIAAIYGVKVWRRSWPLFLFYLLFISFGAVYTRHHYVIDLVAGVAYAAVASLVTDRVLLPYLLARRSRVMEIVDRVESPLFPLQGGNLDQGNP